MEGEPRRSPWPLVVAVLGVAAMTAGVALYLVKRTADLPLDVAGRGREVVGELRSLAEAFRQGTVTTSFTSYATEVSGNSFFQFATLKQVEAFERRDTSTVLWGQLALPDVVIEARAPVEYTYYLDLNKPWSLRLESGFVWVTAPRIEWNTPAIDASALHFEVREGSIFRDEVLARDRLQAGLSEMARVKARQNVSLVREVGRRKTEEFVENWLVRGFRDGASYRARVVFADEPAAVASAAGPVMAPPPPSPERRP
jgi:hypothetical protein